MSDSSTLRILPSWVYHASKRAITEEEHLKIIEREKNPERRAFYELCWYLGGSQKDIAELTAEDVNWSDRTLCYPSKMLPSYRKVAMAFPSGERSMASTI